MSKIVTISIIIICIIIIIYVYSSCDDEINDLNLSMCPTEFFISVDKKVPDHVFAHKGSNYGFTINGINGRPLTLKVNVKYLFNINTPFHPFYFTESPEGNGSNILSLGVFNIPIESGNVTFIITPRQYEKYKDKVIYYGCYNHPFMGGCVRLKSEKFDF